MTGLEAVLILAAGTAVGYALSLAAVALYERFLDH